MLLPRAIVMAVKLICCMSCSTFSDCAEFLYLALRKPLFRFHLDVERRTQTSTHLVQRICWHRQQRHSLTSVNARLFIEFPRAKRAKSMPTRPPVIARHEMNKVMARIVGLNSNSTALRKNSYTTCRVAITICQSTLSGIDFAGCYYMLT